MDSWFSAPPLLASTAVGASTPSISSRMFRSPSAIILGPTVLFTVSLTITLDASKMNLVPLGNIVAALVFAFVGLFIFGIAFMVMDKITRYHLWTEIVREHNM